MTDHTSISDDETWLYRLYRKDGTLLYVGITKDWNQRVKQHRRQQPWWGDVDAVFKQLFASRAAAEAAEAAAIQTENPAHNKAGKHRDPRAPHSRNLKRRQSVDIWWQCDHCSRTAAWLVVPMAEWKRSQAHRVEWHWPESGSSHERLQASLISGVELYAADRRMAWRFRCEEHQEAYEPESVVYEILLARLRSEKDLLEMTAHLLEKDWFHESNWSNVLRARRTRR
jgi:predicted GIY-YIG superfamily endonuclease